MCCVNIGVETPVAAPGVLDEVDLAAAVCLKLPGKRLNLSILNRAKKFRNCSYSTGAQVAFEKLVKDGIGEQDPPLDETSSGKAKVQ